MVGYSTKDIDPSTAFRKSEKKKEKRKNKETRLEHRKTIKKSKDVEAQFNELQLLDEVYFAKKLGRILPNEPRASLSEIVLHDKEKKALKAINDVIANLSDDNPEKATALKGRLKKFYADRMARNKDMENFSHSQNIDIRTIPLPEPQSDPKNYINSKWDNATTIKEVVSEDMSFFKDIGAPPSPPNGPPPDINDLDDDQNETLDFHQPININIDGQQAVDKPAPYINNFVPTIIYPEQYAPNVNMMPLVPPQAPIQFQMPLPAQNAPSGNININLNQNPIQNVTTNPASAVIQAAPKIRNLMSEATQMKPVSVLSRISSIKNSHNQTNKATHLDRNLSAQHTEKRLDKISIDDAYNEFMMEIN